MSYIVTTLANCSRIPLNVKKKYTGDMEEEETSNLLTGRLALEAVKSRANGGGKGRQSPTMQLQVIVGQGEGRAKREFEIWWPELFSHTNQGKLTLRFYAIHNANKPLSIVYGSSSFPVT